MRYAVALFSFLTLVPVMTMAQAQTQNYAAGPRSLEFCVRQMSPELYNYGYKTSTGLIGAYQFNVNALFDAGVCTGKAPAYQSTNWSLCNFRGLPAVDNNITGIDSFLLNNQAQDMYMQHIIDEKAVHYVELAKDGRFRKRANAATLLSALGYRKSKKAIELYLKMGVIAIDKRGRNIEQYLAEMTTCGGTLGNIKDTVGTRLNPKRNYQMKLPISFQWLNLDEAVLKKQLDSFAKKPKELVAYLQAKKTDSIMYATVDLNGNNIPDYQYWFMDSNYCGDTQCFYILVEDNGKEIHEVGASKIRPAPYGVYISGYYHEIYE